MNTQNGKTGTLTQQHGQTAQEPQSQQHQPPPLPEGGVLVRDVITGSQIALLPSTCW